MSNKPRPIEPHEWREATEAEREQYIARSQTRTTEQPEGLFFFAIVLLCVVLFGIFALLSST